MRKALLAALVLSLLVLGVPGETFSANQPDDSGTPDYTTLAKLGTINPSAGQVGQPEFSLDGRRFAYIRHPSGTLVVTDLESGDKLLEFEGWEVRYFVFGPGGNIAAKAKDGVYVWDANGNQLAAFLDVGTADNLACSPDGSVVAFGSESGMLYHFDPATGKQLETFDTGLSWALNADFSPDGSLVALNNRKELKVFKVADGSLAWTAASPEGTSFDWGLDFSPDGKTIACTAGVYSTKDGSVVSTFDKRRFHVQFTPTGKEIVSSRGGEVVVHSSADGTEVTSFKSGSSQYSAPSISLSPDGSHIAVVQYSTIELFGFRRAPVVLPGHEGKTTSMQFSRDASRLLVCSDDGSARVWDVAKRSTLTTLKPETSFKLARLSPDGKQVLFAGEKGLLELRDIASGKVTKTYRAEGAEFVSLDFSPDGKLIATAEDIKEQPFKVWDVQSGEIKKQFEGSFVRRVRFSSDGTLLVCATYSKVTVRTVSDWADGASFNFYASEIILSPDGKVIAGPESTYGTVKRYSTRTGEQLKLPEGAPGAKATKVCYGAGGLAYSGDVPSWWSDSSGTTWTRFDTNAPIEQVECSPDGLLLAGSRGTEVCLWSITPPANFEVRHIEHPDIIAAREARLAVYASGKGFRGAALLRATDTHLFFFIKEADGYTFNAVPHGSTSATVLARAPEGESWPVAHSLTTGKRLAYFTVSAPKVGRVLYVSDGTPEGTKRVGLLPTGADESNRFFVFQDKLFCSAGSGNAASELYCTDGSDIGKVVKPLHRSSNGWLDGNSDPHDFFVHKEKLYFFASPEYPRLALYTTDGTEEGTTLEGNLGGGQDAEAWVVATIGDTVYIAERTRPGGSTPSVTLWSFDGTSVHMVYQGFQGWNSLLSACVLNNKLYFRATTERPGDYSRDELWVSDGQNAGTMQVKKFIDADNYIKVSGVTTAGGLVLVSTVHKQESGDDARCELWSYNPADGTGRWVAPFMKYSLGMWGGDLDSEVRFEEVGGRAWLGAAQRRIGGTIVYTDGKRLGSLGDPDPEEDTHSIHSFYRYGDKFACFLICRNHVKVCLADPIKETFSLVTRDPK